MGRVAADPSDLVEPIDRPERGLPSRVGAGGIGWWPGLRHRCDELLDAVIEPIHLLAERVDLVEQHPHQFGVMGVEAAGQRLDERVVLAAQPAQCQLGQHLRVTLTVDQRLQHRPAGLAEQVRRHRRQLDQGVLQQLLHSLLVAGAFLHQVMTQPGAAHAAHAARPAARNTGAACLAR